MSIQTKITSVICTIAFCAMCALPSEQLVSVAFISSIILYGFNQWLETKDSKVSNDLNDRIKKIEDRVQVIMIGKGGGR